MPNIGPVEIIIVLIIVLVIFGPKRLPELGRSLGSGMRNFKNSVTGDKDDDDKDEKPAAIEPASDTKVESRAKDAEPAKPAGDAR
jgi:sec-independent protein translocase protein TatA